MKITNYSDGSMDLDFGADMVIYLDHKKGHLVLTATTPDHHLPFHLNRPEVEALRDYLTAELANEKRRIAP